MTAAEYKARVADARKIVFFGGAGVSTESGIPDFRSVDGLYSRKYTVPPETVLSAEYFYSHTEEFYKFYFDKMIFRDAVPNAAHIMLAEWEMEGKLLAVVTQNIDGLHRAAGSKNVFELHGTVESNRCLRCGKRFGLNDVIRFAPNVPICDCGGIIKPDVVLYGESLPEAAVNGAAEAISDADLLIIGGTSLTVYPAAGFVGYFRGGADNIIVINITELSGFKNSLIGKIGELL